MYSVGTIIEILYCIPGRQQILSVLTTKGELCEAEKADRNTWSVHNFLQPCPLPAFGLWETSVKEYV